MGRFASNPRVLLAQFFNRVAVRVLGASSHEEMGGYGKLGLILACLFLALSGIWIFTFSQGNLHYASLSLVGLAIVISMISMRRKLTARRGNLLALGTHLTALLAFYLFSTHYLLVVYYTDSMVSTYMGIINTLQGQNPYMLSIKPLLDQFGFSPSRYTPRVDGSFEFNLNYPAFNFLSLLPLYLAGLHDLRDGVLVYLLLSILLVYGIAPPRLKALSLVPFSLGYPYAIVFSWTDQVWVFILLLAAALWHKHTNLSLASVGLAGATKQVALAAAPFVIIRLWHETKDSGKQLIEVTRGLGIMLTTFMIPNLPFILLSPSAWWASVVRPFIPAGAPLVPGGVGLSGVLQDLGIALSPFFFTVLTITVTGASIFLFATRFSKLNHYLWAMPILTFFFYSRSFPHYIVYWGLPVILETLQRRNLEIVSTHRQPSRHFSWPRVPRISLAALRRKLTPSFLVTLTIAAVLAGASAAYISETSQTKGSVEVTSVSDPDSLGTATLMTVTVSNHEPRPISPRFFIKWYFIPFYWASNSTVPLQPSTTATYALTATDTFAAIPRSSTFFVMVYDSITGDFVAQSKTLNTGIAEPPVVNPYLRWWSLDLSTGLTVPFGWHFSITTVQDASASFTPLYLNGTSGLEMRINQSSSRLSEVAMSQTLLFDNSNLTLRLFQSLTTDPGKKVMLSFKVTEGRHLLYIIFSSTVASQTVARYSENTTVTIPLQTATWTTVPVNIPSLWNSQGWSIPATLEGSLFLDAGASGIHYAQVSEIRTE